ncbi:hypothetical protein J9303_08805, partial [Bacillaceae bacterium Marseille-Q3522]|nr:hypothetical protein [Bacillaceae bacterium Marseille-Q3522]
MHKIKDVKLSFVMIAIVLLWLKTYIVYKTSFDINLENWRQAFILFINPLSFLMFILGIGMFMKEKRQKRYILIVSLLISGILYANVVFYREFTDFLTIPVILQTENMGDLGSSISNLLNVPDLMYFTDFFILLIIALWKPSFVSFKEYNKMSRRVFYLLTVAISFFNLGLAESERPQLLTRAFDREMLIKNIGTYNYHLYDIFLQSKSTAQRVLADGSQMVDIENYSRANYKNPNE